VDRADARAILRAHLDALKQRSYADLVGFMGDVQVDVETATAIESIRDEMVRLRHELRHEFQHGLCDGLAENRR
jgi:hypothetical protein